MKATPVTRSVKELAEAVAGPEKALLPNPEYQRGGVRWTPAQKQALIDSLLRGYHIPLIYIHLEQRETSLGDKNTYRWIIDGQQRLNAIAGFLGGGFALHEAKKDADEFYLGKAPRVGRVSFSATLTRRTKRASGSEDFHGRND